MPTELCSTGTFRRALASNSVRPSTAMTPSSGISSPAMQRSVVVLPQPEGPSKVKNVPGSSVKLASRMPPAIWSVELSKILVSPSTRNIRPYAPVSLTPALLRPPQRAGGRVPRHGVEDDRDHRHQHRPHQPKRRKLGALAIAPQVEHRDRHGLRARPSEQDRKRERARRHQEDEQPAGDQRRRQEWRNDPPQSRQRRRATDRGGFFELAMDLQHAGGAVAHAVGQIVDDEGPDQNAERAVERDRNAQEHLHHRDAENKARKHQRDGGKPLDDPAAGTAPHGQPGAQEGQRYRDGGGRDRDQQRVDHQLELSGGEHGAVVVEADELERSRSHRLEERQ